MAEGFQGTQNVLCRYFMNGVCREGANCHFSHDRGNTRPSLACRYYLKGSCTYGDNCRYDHIRAERLEAMRKPAPPPLPVISPSSHTNSLSTCNQGEKTHSPKPKDLKFTVLNKKSSLCVDAPEFVPKSFVPETPSSQVTSSVSYAQVVGVESNEDEERTSTSEDSFSELCPYNLISGICHVGETCTYVHGLVCEICQLACLHPHDEKQRNTHLEECTKLMEAEMEHSFAVARSREKVCGICMDMVMERNLPSQRRFGILPNCSHCFCLDCIRKWRQSKQFENKIIRSCPECRVQSDYIIPSRYWVDDKDKEEKEKLVDSYRVALSEKPCKYFKQGEGQCPFGNKCFYLHALPDGTKKDVGPPKRRRRLTGELLFDNAVLWDYIEEREHHLEVLRGSIQTLLLELELDELSDDFFFPDDSLSEASDI